MPTTVGARLRDARIARHLSLREVASVASISVATLSRIETNKQNLELGLFLSIARILNLPPQELLDETDGTDGVEPMVERIGALTNSDRMRLWRDLAVAARNRNSHRLGARKAAQQVDELLAQLDLIRAEIEAVSGRLKQ